MAKISPSWYSLRCSERSSIKRYSSGEKRRLILPVSNMSQEFYKGAGSPLPRMLRIGIGVPAQPGQQKPAKQKHGRGQQTAEPGGRALSVDHAHRDVHVAADGQRQEERSDEIARPRQVLEILGLLSLEHDAVI